MAMLCFFVLVDGFINFSKHQLWLLHLTLLLIVFSFCLTFSSHLLLLHTVVLRTYIRLSLLHTLVGEIYMRLLVYSSIVADYEI